jgi:CelD/BcsL family acetyltransferase involved in cellulose biosynthesis
VTDLFGSTGPWPSTFALWPGKLVACPPVSKVATLESDPRRLEGEWEELARRSSATPFHHLGWIRAWWSAFGRGTLMLVTLRDSGKLAAAMPLRVTGSRLASPSNWHTPVFGPIADGPESARDLFDYMFELDFRSVDLSFLEVEDGTLSLAAQSAERAGRLLFTRRLMRSPWVALDGSWEDYERTLSRNRRRSVRRALHRLRDEGAVSLEINEGGPHVGALLEDAFRLEASGWKGRSGTAIASSPDTRRFYTEIATWAAEKGWLRLSFLRLDGTALAFDLSLELDGVRYSLKSGYDAAFAHTGAGAVLLYELLRQSHATGIERFELLAPEDEFKLAWANGVSDRAWLRACAPSPSGRAEATFVRARERIRPVARQVRARVAS